MISSSIIILLNSPFIAVNVDDIIKKIKKAWYENIIWKFCNSKKSKLLGYEKVFVFIKSENNEDDDKKKIIINIKDIIKILAILIELRNAIK